MNKPASFWTLPVVALILAATEAQALPYYSITDLGSLGGSSSDAEDINNLGQIVGYAQTAGDTAYHATLWQNGAAQDLGSLAGSANSWAYGINERGQIVGDSGTISGGGKGGIPTPTTLPTLWQNGSPQALSATAGSAQDINEAGQVVGSTVYKFETHAAVWQNGTLKDLGLIGQASTVQAINDSGQIAGAITTSVYPSPAYWTGPNGKVIAIKGSPAFGLYQDINNVGQIVGVSGKLASASAAGVPFLVANGATQYLPTPNGNPGAALGINDAGWAVGWVQSAANAKYAMLWQNGQGFDLNRLLAPGSAGFALASANAINDLGQIVGQLATGHAYLANPAGTATWTGGSGGWEAGGNWEQGFKPGKLQDPVIAPTAGAVTIDGPQADTEVNSLNIGGAAGSVDLNLNGGNLTVTGDVRVGANSHVGVTTGKALAVAGSYTQTAGSASVDGVLRAASINIQSGVLDGTGSLQGTVTIGTAASVNPGHSPGLLNIVGDFVLNGTLNIEIADPVLFDTLNITGNADFSAGTINFSFLNGFLPQPGDSFQWLAVGGTVLGWDLAQIHVGSLPAGLQYSFGAGNVLQFSALPDSPPPPSAAVPEPGTGLLLLAGLLGLRRCQRSRQSGFAPPSRLYL